MGPDLLRRFEPTSGFPSSASAGSPRQRRRGDPAGADAVAVISAVCARPTRRRQPATASSARSRRANLTPTARTAIMAARHTPSRPLATSREGIDEPTHSFRVVVAWSLLAVPCSFPAAPRRRPARARSRSPPRARSRRPGRAGRRHQAGRPARRREAQGPPREDGLQGRAGALRRSGQARRRRGQRQEHHRRQGHPGRDRPPELRASPSRRRRSTRKSTWR